MRASSNLSWMLVLVLGVVSAGEAGEADGETVFRTVCAVCHGESGEGKREVLAPSIAGLPDWFVMLQIEKFRSGQRGHEKDPAGLLMRGIAQSLPLPSLEAVARHVAGLPVGEASEGEATLEGPVHDFYYEVCAPCHRYNGQGERVFRSAPLTTLSGWYLEGALRKFRDGLRGYEDGDEEGRKMREVTKAMSDETIVEVVAYIGGLASAYPPGVRRERIR